MNRVSSSKYLTKQPSTSRLKYCSTSGAYRGQLKSKCVLNGIVSFIEQNNVPRSRGIAGRFRDT